MKVIVNLVIVKRETYCNKQKKKQIKIKQKATFNLETVTVLSKYPLFDMIHAFMHLGV